MNSCFDCLQLRVELRETRSVIEQMNGRLQQQNMRLDRLEHRFDTIDRKLSLILGCASGSNAILGCSGGSNAILGCAGGSNAILGCAGAPNASTKISPGFSNNSQQQKNGPILVSATASANVTTPATATIISIPISSQESPQNSRDQTTPNSSKRVEVESAITTEPFTPSQDQFVHIAGLKLEPIDHVLIEAVEPKSSPFLIDDQSALGLLMEPGLLHAGQSSDIQNSRKRPFDQIAINPANMDSRRPKQCPYCYKWCSRIWSVKRHVAAVHPELFAEFDQQNQMRKHSN